MNNYIVIAIISMIAGLTQGITGFGGGVILMMILPMFYDVITSAGISSAICIVLCFTLAYHYRKSINYKNIGLSNILYLSASSLSILIGKNINQNIMKLYFGIFLIILSIYFIFIAKDIKIKLTSFISMFCILVSGLCDGLFGIGGPLMVIYYLNKTQTTEEYLGTIQAFFLINAIYTTLFRIYNHILLVEHIPIIVIGMIGIMTGGKLATQIVDKLNGELLKKLTYVLIGICGLTNIIQVIL